MGWDDDYYTVPWTLIWSLTAVGIVLIVKGAFLIWYFCYYRPRRLQALRAAQQNHLSFAPGQYGYTVGTTNQYGVPTSSAGPIPDKNAAPPPAYSEAYNGGFNAGPEGGTAPYPQAGAPYPQAGAPYPQAGPYPPAGAMGGNMVNPPSYEASSAPHPPPQK